MGLRGGLVHDREYRLNLDVSASCRPGMGRWSITVDGRNEVSRHDVRKDVMVVGNMTMEGRGEGDCGVVMDSFVEPSRPARWMLQ